MIPRFAVRDYLNRKLDDHRWVKKLAHRELDDALAGLRPAAKLPGARSHQKACFLLGVAYPRFGFFIEMGGGKTRLALDLLRYWFDTGRVRRRALILVISDKAYSTWEDQISRFNIGLPYVFLDGSTERKWEQLASFGDGLVFCHYPGMVAMLTRRVEVDGKTKWAIDWDAVKAFSTGIEAVVLDESTKVGNEASLTHQLVDAIAQGTICYALAGRAFGRDPTMLWSQYKILDGGETLGGQLGLFRSVFFDRSVTKVRRRRRERNIKKETFNKRMMPALTRMIQHRAITYTVNEMPDLPPLQATRMIEPVRLPDAAAAYYDGVIEEIIAAKGQVAMMQNAFVRMRQLSSGFMVMRTEDGGERLEVKFRDNPKLQRLLELLEAVPEGRKAVVFYEFTFSGKWITDTLRDADLGDFIWLWSGTRDPSQELRDFVADPDVTIAVVNNRIGAYSIDELKAANYLFFYESPVSVLDREQAEKRVLRQGQQYHVFQYDLVVRDTVDEKILQFHREGRDLMRELTAAPEEFFVK